MDTQKEATLVKYVGFLSAVLLTFLLVGLSYLLITNEQARHGDSAVITTDEPEIIRMAEEGDFELLFMAAEMSRNTPSSPKEYFGASSEEYPDIYVIDWQAENEIGSELVELVEDAVLEPPSIKGSTGIFLENKESDVEVERQILELFENAPLEDDLLEVEVNEG